MIADFTLQKLHRADAVSLKSQHSSREKAAQTANAESDVSEWGRRTDAAAFSPACSVIARGGVVKMYQPLLQNWLSWGYPGTRGTWVPTEKQKSASMASALVLFFPLAVLIFRLSTRKMCLFWASAKVVIRTIGTAVLIFGLCTVVLTFGLCMYKISTASVTGSVVVCIISTDLLIFVLSNQPICGLKTGIIACFVKSQNKFSFWRFG